MENLILIDWLSFTSKCADPQYFVWMIGMEDAPWTITKGAHGYTDRLYYDSISIHYGGRPDMGTWLEMSGQGCRAFESYSSISWADLITRFFSESYSYRLDSPDWLRCTRLDVAYDDHTGVLPLDRIGRDCVEGNFVSRSEYWSNTTSSVGCTIQHGSPQSEVLIRIYDKAAERHTDGHWVRCEIQLRRDRALKFLELIHNGLVIGDAYLGVLLNYLRYVLPGQTDSNRWRWEMSDYWSAFVLDAQRISIYSAPGTDYNLDRCKNYVFNLAGNAIDCLLQIYGVDDFKTLLNARTSAPNPKYAQLVSDAKKKWPIPE